MAKARSLAVKGSGTAQAWGAPLRPVEVVLDTTALDQVIVYNPADMTVAVGAGMPLRALQDRLAESGQRVSLDAARIDGASAHPHGAGLPAAGATVGGLLATADAGPLRHTHGSLRDLVLGVTVVLADGTVSRSGGHVVKNVAGYDLAKLISGSLGSYGLVTEMVLRLHPLPESTGSLAVRADPATALDIGSTLLRSPLEPVAVDFHDGQLLARFEGTRASVTTRLDKAVALVDRPTEVFRGDDEVPAWQGIRETTLGREGDTIFRAGTAPAQLSELADHLQLLTDEHAVEAELTSSIGVGVHTIRLREGTAAGHAAVLRSWRTHVVETGGSLTLHRRIEGLDELASSWGDPPSSAPVMRALKQRLDPESRLSPGRFSPWM